MACCGTRSRVDGPEVCTLCLDPLPLPGPGADVVLKLHACGHCFHRDCAQEMLLNALRRYEKPRCPNCRATLDTAPFGKLLGQRRQPRKKRMANMRELISVSEVGHPGGLAKEAASPPTTRHLSTHVFFRAMLLKVLLYLRFYLLQYTTKYDFFPAIL